MTTTGAIEATMEGKAPPPDERRKQRRLACSGFAEVIVADGSFLFRGAVHDLSRTGCYISSRAQLSLLRGTEVELLLILDSDQLTVAARVMTVRRGKGAGFEFLRVDESAEKRVARWINNLDLRAVASEKHRAAAEAASLNERGAGRSS